MPPDGGGGPVGLPRLGLIDRFRQLLDALARFGNSDRVGAPRLGVRVRTSESVAARRPQGVSLGRRSRSAGDLARIDRGAREAFARRFGREPDEAVNRDTAALARELAATLQYELHVRGRHYGGLSNQDLLAVRKREGRDFAKDTPSLREHARRALVGRFRAGEWDEDEATTVASAAILEWIVMRIDGEATDITKTPLSPAYAAWKASKGKGGEPIGVFRGRWRDAVERMGDVNIVSSH